VPGSRVPPARRGGTGQPATSTITDALGRTTAIREYKAATPTGAYDSTTYKFNRKSQLEKVTDAAGNHWDYTYDLRGRQLTAADPDKGTVTSTYDAAGRVTSTLDARNVKLQYTYDNLDRRTAVLQTGVGTRARWFYDTLAKGQLDKSIRYVGTANYIRQINAYDDSYRPTQETVTIPTTETGLGGSYTSESYYNVDGSLTTTGYPAAGNLPLESVSYQYDPTTGLPTTSSSTFNNRSISYAGRTTYDALGRVSELMLYPGLYDGIGKRVYQTYGYELETGRLTATRTDRESVALHADQHQLHVRQRRQRHPHGRRGHRRQPVLPVRLPTPADPGVDARHRQLRDRAQYTGARWPRPVLAVLDL
jgi:YD repeat-containing protein